METFGKSKGSGSPRLAPKVVSPGKKHPNFMREKLAPSKGKSPMAPMTGKKLSK